MRWRINSYVESENKQAVYSEIEYTRLVDTPLVRFGSESRPAQGAGWGCDQLVERRPVVAFSLLPIDIQYRDGESVVLSPAIVGLPGKGQVYERSVLAPKGQRTLWMTIEGDLLARMTARLDPSAEDRPGQPAKVPFGPADPMASALALALYRRAFKSRDPIEPLLLEEMVLKISERAVETAVAAMMDRKPPRRVFSAQTLRVQRESVNAACMHLNLNSAEKLSLAELSDVAELSPGYLCRLFSEHTGMTLNKYLTTVRTVRALERLPDSRGKLSALAYDCGFSSHAHMVTTFRRMLGCTPTEINDIDSARALESLRAVALSAMRPAG